MRQASFCGVPLSVWGPSPTTRTSMNIGRIWPRIRCWRLARAAATPLLLQRTTWYRVGGIGLSPARRGDILTRWGIEVFGEPIEKNKIPAEKFDNICHLQLLGIHPESVRAPARDLADSTAG